MMQTEESRISKEDRQELERQIKSLEYEIENNPNMEIKKENGIFNSSECDEKIKELRRLRRLRK